MGDPQKFTKMDDLGLPPFMETSIFWDKSWQIHGTRTSLVKPGWTSSLSFSAALLKSFQESCSILAWGAHEDSFQDNFHLLQPTEVTENKTPSLLNHGFWGVCISIYIYYVHCIIHR